MLVRLTIRPPLWARSRRAPIKLLCACWALVTPLTANAQLGNVAGSVVTTTGDGVGNVVVSIVGTSLSAVTTPGGNFSINGVPAGPRVIRWARIGLQPGVRDITVLPNQTIQVNLVVTVEPIPIGLISPDPPDTPLPPDSLKIPVPDSVIIGVLDQRKAFIPVNFQVGQRFRLIGVRREERMIEIVSVRRTGDVSEASGVVVSQGFRGGLVTIFSNGTNVTANIRHGLRLYMIRPQYRGIHLLIEVDARRLSGNDDSNGERRSQQ